VSAKFGNLFDAGMELGSLLNQEHSDLISDSLIACVMPNGVPVALGIESVVGARNLLGIHLSRTTQSVILDPEFAENFDVNLVAGKRVIVVDDGVETGTAAMVCGTWLTSLGVAELVLAVPICPRTAMNQLQFPLPPKLSRLRHRWVPDHWPGTTRTLTSSSMKVRRRSLTRDQRRWAAKAHR